MLLLKKLLFYKLYLRILSICLVTCLFFWPRSTVLLLLVPSLLLKFPLTIVSLSVSFIPSRKYIRVTISSTFIILTAALEPMLKWPTASQEQKQKQTAFQLFHPKHVAQHQYNLLRLKTFSLYNFCTDFHEISAS